MRRCAPCVANPPSLPPRRARAPSESGGGGLTISRHSGQNSPPWRRTVPRPLRHRAVTVMSPWRGAAWSLRGASGEPVVATPPSSRLESRRRGSEHEHESAHGRAHEAPACRGEAAAPERASMSEGERDGAREDEAVTGGPRPCRPGQPAPRQSTGIRPGPRLQPGGWAAKHAPAHRGRVNPGGVHSDGPGAGLTAKM